MQDNLLYIYENKKVLEVEPFVPTYYSYAGSNNFSGFTLTTDGSWVRQNRRTQKNNGFTQSAC
jgi:hypothetical protein